LEDVPQPDPLDPPATGAWRRVAHRAGPTLRIFRARFDRMVNPRTGSEVEAVVLETPTWANVVALTPEREMVLVRQHRFGIDGPTTEIPGGMVELDEAPLLGAQRELLEETGYSSQRWSALGSSQPNPAFHNNLCHHFLAEDCQRTAEPALDEGEDVEVFLRPIADVVDAVRRGQIQNSLVLCALAKVFDLRIPG